jgi:hypothetical protein
MKNLKDNEKTAINSYGQSSVSNFKSLLSKPLYEYVNKKTGKIVTALYMVTDYMEDVEPLKSKLRVIGVNLLSDMYTLSVIPPIERDAHISTTLVRIYELLSFIEIANTIGFISDMNTSILKRELVNLIKGIEDPQSKDKHFTFALDEQMFSVVSGEVPEERGDTGESKGQQKDSYAMSDKTKSVLSRVSNLSKSHPQTSLYVAKDDRSNKIISLLKDKSNGPMSLVGVSIKDISTQMTDCSEKTIQRELNSLVAKNQVIKIGEKRWSRYRLGSVSKTS